MAANTFIVTIAGTDYPAYADLATANAYLAAKLDATAWVALTDDQKGAALVSMTRTLDRQVWQGAPTDGYEPPAGMAWPRSGLSYPDGTPVDSTSIPDAVVYACIEGANLLASGSDLESTSSTASLTRSLKAGSVAIEYFRQIDQQSRFPQAIMELIGFWLGGSNSGMVAVATGTCGETAFGDCEQYDVNQAF